MTRGEQLRQYLIRASTACEYSLKLGDAQRLLRDDESVSILATGDNSMCNAGMLQAIARNRVTLKSEAMDALQKELRSELSTLHQCAEAINKIINEVETVEIR